MTSQNIIIYDFKELFSILEEIKEILKFNLIFVNNTNKELYRVYTPSRYIFMFLSRNQIINRKILSINSTI